MTVTPDTFLIIYGSLLILGLAATVVGCFVLEWLLQATARLLRSCFKGYW